MSKEEIEANKALKFVWAYMLKEGRPTSGEWSYYGGRWGYPTVPNRYYPKERGYITEMSWEETNSLMQRILTEVKDVGINWEKTKAPKGRTHSEFEGTENESSSCETLLGTLILKDGASYTIGVANTEKRFMDYVLFLNAFMQDKQMLKDILGEDL